MATRTADFDDRVDPRLLKLIESVVMPGYRTNLISGFREYTKKNPRSRHKHGGAIDVELIDEKTGRALPNYQSPESFKTYQQYANLVYRAAMASDPQLAAQLAWGGYFSGPKEVYGAMDLMHFDTGGQQAGGDWRRGLKPEQAALWGLEPGGGLGDDAGDAPGYSQYALMPDGPKGQEVWPTRAPPLPPGRDVKDMPVAEAQEKLPPMPTVKGDKEKTTFAEALGDGVTAMGDVKPLQPLRPSAQPAAARMDAEAPLAPFNAQQAEQQRQMLALAMQRLNSGRLF